MFDIFDASILKLLQTDGRLTNNEIAERVNLSASQCSRRRMRLEQTGVIRGYAAQLDREKTGFPLISIITVTISTHTPGNAARFAELVRELPEVLEAHSLTGEMDYFVKIITRDLRNLSDFINRDLLSHDFVQNVKSAVVLETLKETNCLPVSAKAQPLSGSSRPTP